jgi:hypothetical protein
LLSHDAATAFHVISHFILYARSYDGRSKRIG